MRTLDLLTVLILAVLHVSSSIEFQWSTLKAGKCVANDTMIGRCSKPRGSQCLNKDNDQAVPDYYCYSTGVSPKPSLEIPCDRNHCARQRCVVSGWSEWNPCDPACVVSFKYRTRSILWRERQNDPCPDLIEKKDCSHCTRGSDKDIYLWMADKWGSCRHFTDITVYLDPDMNTTTTAGTKVCGPSLRLGKSTRRVRCVDAKGLETKARNCLNSKDKYGRITQRPGKSKVCQLPCDCHLSTWSDWSGCRGDCSTMEETRTRMVLYPTQLNGKPCESLIEKRACSTKCTAFKWYATPWGKCQVYSPPGLSNYSGCGHGYQERSHVFCIKSSTNMIDFQPVDDDLCDPTTKLSSRQTCQVSCPNHCKVSDWHEWQACSVSCGKYGVKKRERTILTPASHGGMECPHLIETSPCGKPYCSMWATVQWSQCWASGCGKVGIKVRPVYCHGSKGYLSNDHCSHLLRPNNRMNCSRPCPNDCALSDWGEWGPCSKSCGIYGGTQVRYKTILAYPGVNQTSCPPTDQLKEIRKCNQDTFCEKDSNFMWRFTPWSACVPFVSGTCGVAKGTMKRGVTCATYTKVLDSNDSCSGIPKPVEDKQCDVPCKKDCIVSKWRPWSDCSKTCGSKQTQSRQQFVLQEPTLSGKPCPSGVVDGVKVETRSCPSVPPCFQYKWTATDWTKCKIVPQTKPTEKCGNGFQTRNVSCVRSDKQVVSLSFCYLSLLTPPPHTLKECWEPCSQSCVRSGWSDWSTCPETCTTTSPAYRQRTRTVLNLSPARGGFVTTCPQLTALDFAEREVCPDVPCYTYKWRTGPWQSIQTKLTDCSHGKRRRNVLCQRSDNMFVSDSYCNNTKKPSSSVRSLLVCDVDCVVSNWRPWSTCPELCGKSIQVRNRTIVKQPVGLGRACPTLYEKRLCHKTPCTEFKWSIGVWNTCKTNMKDAKCGNGTQTRQVSCKPDPTMEAICLKQAPKPGTVQDCVLPCLGDCVLSNWAVWSDCVNGWQGCIKTRWRLIVRKPSDTKLSCSNITQETQRCDCPAAGNLVVSEWTSCKVNKSEGVMCGQGRQSRSVKCLGKRGEVLDDIYCTKKDTIGTVQSCVVSCPVDCVLSKWSDWSRCSDACGIDRTMNSTRYVLADGKNGGRKCPDNSSLVRKVPCPGGPCSSYSLDEGKWSKCNVDGQGCGYGTKTREIRCRRNDGKSVELYHCFDKTKSNKESKLAKLDILQNVLNNITKLSILMKQTCVDPCPGNCVVSEWSDWSKCGRTCFEQNGQSSQSRSRVIISKASAGGRACPSTLSESRNCHPLGDKCIGVEWKVGAWQKNGKRQVWCEATNGVRVSETCVANDKPSSTKFCDPKCSDTNAVCKDGVCICKPRFEVFQKQCIPINGCLSNSHCVHANTSCKKQLCQCRAGYVKNVTTGECVFSDIPVKTTMFSTTPTEPSTRPLVITTPKKDHTKQSTDAGKKTTAKDNDDYKKEALTAEETEDYMKWIGISAGVLLFCILLVIGVFCYTRRQRKTKKQKYSREKENSIELIGMQVIPGDETLPAKV